MGTVREALRLICDRLRHEDPPAVARHSTCRWCARPAGCCDCQERIDCPKTSWTLHQMCGWCGACDVPMFQCQRRHWESRPPSAVKGATT